MRKHFFTTLGVSLIAFGLVACTEDKAKPITVQLNQTNICVVKDLSSNNLEAALKDCTPGQKFAWLASAQDDDQAPVVVAATLCDFRYAVVYASSGVTCIYLKADDVPKKPVIAPVPAK